MAKKKKMTKKRNSGTLSTRGSSDKKESPPKDPNVEGRMRSLLGLGNVRCVPHANTRMGERNIIYYEILQALHSSKYIEGRDRYSTEWNSWEYTFEGYTMDKKKIRVGVSFETTVKGEKLLIITVIDIT